MLYRSTCRRASQPRLRSSLEPTWISDAILCHEWERFLLRSKICRRHGSSVPDPLESRRRLGKRRMAYVSESFPRPLPGITSLWDSLWEKDISAWQWQPPRKRDRCELDDAESPWVPEAIDPAHYAEEIYSVTMAEPIVATGIELTIDQEITLFRSRLKHCKSCDLPAICDHFIRTFKQNIALGRGHFSIRTTLEGIDGDLDKWFPDFATVPRLALYRATWEGLFEFISAWHPDKFEGLARSDMDQAKQICDHISVSLIQLLNLQNMTEDVAMFSLRVMITLSQNQLTSAAISVHDLTIRTVRSWLQEHCQILDTVATESAASTKRSDNLLDAVELPFPAQLIRLFHKLDTTTLARIIASITQIVTHNHLQKDSISKDSRYFWLNLVAQIPNKSVAKARKSIFFDTWRTMDTPIAPLKQNLSSHILVEHFLAQGLFGGKRLRKITRYFLALEDISDRVDPLMSIVASFEQHYIMIHIMRGRFLDALLDLRQYDTIYHMLYRMEKSTLKLSPALYGKVINTISEHNPSLAWRVYKLFRVDDRRERILRLEFCHKFMLSMIRKTDIPPSQIWSCIEAPSGSPEMCKLIAKMAVAFAHCKHHRPRVMLRNVEKCLHLLWEYGASLDPEVSRAVTYVCIGMRLELEQGVPEDRAAWALNIVRIAEGRDIAESVAVIIKTWNARMCEENLRRRHLLGGGPID